MSIRNAKATWNGTLKEGKGTMALGSGAFEGPFSFNTRMGDEPGTNPEELIGAALAGCFTMALNAGLEKEGFKTNGIKTDAKVNFGKDGEGFAITKVDLETEADVEGIEDGEFQQIAEKTKSSCPVSKALAGTEIVLNATLVKSQAAG
ncbi:MAG: OsmC family peroxiredoxin [Acidobacteriota bacterium]|jgi:osmotically inducible protein OsmC|nr:OsmC family peroxiredoxin [Blastocatellia bacterium]MDQ3219379.1 OsmC family peroxiredoxin [Acidobacteriota bacterium]MDQ3490652.1 OsmC family peroxiredoxin [Acidobacteriota bacterium]